MNEDQRKEYLVMIGNRIKQLRLERELSQDELARRSGYGSRSTINKIELGINDVRRSKIKAIAEALGVDVGEILSWDKFDSTYDTKALQKEVSLFEQIEQGYGKPAREAVSLFVQLDTLDQGRAIGSMEKMLEDEKYSVQKELSKSTAS